MVLCLSAGVEGNGENAGNFKKFKAMPWQFKQFKKAHSIVRLPATKNGKEKPDDNTEIRTQQST